jgi:hypothetical protein
MNDFIFIPNRLRSAGRELRLALNHPLNELPRQKFLRVWNCVAYLFPGLHPDGYEDADSGWPRVLKRFAAEAWRRVETGEWSEEELYPCDAQWCGLYDRMHTHAQAETDRRLALAADFGEMV